MGTREIPRESWKEFFEGFTRRHEGWLVDVEVLGPAGAQKEASQMPLEEIAADRRADSIAISLGPRNRATHVIPRPFRIDVEEEEGAERAVQIQSETGEKTLVSFRSALPPEMVDGVLPK